MVITLGNQGAVALDSDGSIVKVPAQLAKVKNTVGAGDGFLACLIYSISLGLKIEQAMINATHVGKIICSKSESALSASDVLILDTEPTFTIKLEKTTAPKG